MTGTVTDLQDDANWVAPQRVKCDGCHKPITQKQAYITCGTSKGRERYHYGCCPWVRRPPAEIAGDRL
jgi:hypothetical protein